MKNYVKFILKNHFFKDNMFQFLLTFFEGIITSIVSSIQTACDAMCVQHVIQ